MPKNQTDVKQPLSPTFFGILAAGMMEKKYNLKGSEKTLTNGEIQYTFYNRYASLLDTSSGPIKSNPAFVSTDTTSFYVYPPHTNGNDPSAAPFKDLNIASLPKVAEYIVIPVALKQSTNHWVLTVVDPNTHQAVIIDSKSKNLFGLLNANYQPIQAILKDQGITTTQTIHTGDQGLWDNWSCGYHVIKTIDDILSGTIDLAKVFKEKTVPHPHKKQIIENYEETLKKLLPPEEIIQLNIVAQPLSDEDEDFETVINTETNDSEEILDSEESQKSSNTDSSDSIKKMLKTEETKPEAEISQSSSEKIESQKAEVPKALVEKILAWGSIKKIPYEIITPENSHCFLLWEDLLNKQTERLKNLPMETVTTTYKEDIQKKLDKILSIKKVIKNKVIENYIEKFMLLHKNHENKASEVARFLIQTAQMLKLQYPKDNVETIVKNLRESCKEQLLKTELSESD
ncbi:MAG: hypothetical protein ACNA7Y_04550, partial [Gammaproteobacteria bacterium]